MSERVSGDGITMILITNIINVANFVENAITIIDSQPHEIVPFVEQKVLLSYLLTLS